MKKKILALLISSMMALSLAACGGGGSKADNKPDQTKEETKVQEEKKEEPKVQEEKKEKPKIAEEHYEIDLTAGNYTAGVDIPIGTYNITATGGSGNVSSSNMYSGGLNAVMSNPIKEGISVDSYKGVKLDKDVVLSLRGTVSIHMVSENAQVAGVTPRTVADATPIDLTSGNYTAGTDFPAATYNIVVTSGSGNVSSDNMYKGGLNEVMGIQADPALYIPQFNNAVFEEGNALKVSGVSIQLVPVGE